MMERFKLVAAAHLFLIKDGKILLARRYNTGWGDGYFSVPAGHVDGSETVTDAMVREAKEEIGITVEKSNLDFVHIMHRKTDREQLDSFFVCQLWKGIPTICESDKCDALEWFTLTSLPQNIIPYVKSAIESFQKKVYYSEFGWEQKI